MPKPIENKNNSLVRRRRMKKHSKSALLTQLSMVFFCLMLFVANIGVSAPLNGITFTYPQSGQVLVAGQNSINIKWTNSSPGQGMSLINIVCEEGSEPSWSNAPVYFVTRTNVGVGRTRFFPFTNNMTSGYSRTVRAVAIGMDGVRYATGPWFTLLYSGNSITFNNTALPCEESIGRIAIYTNSNSYVGPVGHITETLGINGTAHAIMVPVCIEGSYDVLRQITEVSVWTNGVRAGFTTFTVKPPLFISDFNSGTSRPDILEIAQILNYERIASGLAPLKQIETTRAGGAFLEELNNFKTRRNIVEPGNAGPLTLLALNIASTNWYGGANANHTDTNGNVVTIKVNNLIKFVHDITNGEPRSYDVFIKISSSLGEKIQSGTRPVNILVSTPNLADLQPGYAYNSADPARTPLAIWPENRTDGKNLAYIVGQPAQGGKLWIYPTNSKNNSINLLLVGSSTHEYELMQADDNSAWNVYTNVNAYGCEGLLLWKIPYTNGSRLQFFSTRVK